MKRSEVLDTIAYMVLDCKDEGSCSNKTALRILSYLEDIGMQPPVCTVKLVEDKYHGGTKHGPAERVWDYEAE